jgi:hypothetical protein
MFHSLTRIEDFRRSTISCWRRKRFSASGRVGRVNHDRIASPSRVRNPTIGRFVTVNFQLHVIPDKVFGRHKCYRHNGRA